MSPSETSSQPIPTLATGRVGISHRRRGLAPGAEVIHGQRESRGSHAAILGSRLSGSRAIFDAHGEGPVEVGLLARARGFSSQRVAEDIFISREIERTCGIRADGVLRRPGFDVIHACNPPDLFFGIGAVYRLLGTSFVFDVHDLTPETFRAQQGGREVLLCRILLACERLTYAWLFSCGRQS